jgi:hypothetical protein
MDDDAVGVPAQHAIDRGEGECLRWCKPKAGCNQTLARALFEIVSSVENLARPRRQYGLAPAINQTECAADIRGRRSMRRDRAAAVPARLPRLALSRGRVVLELRPSARPWLGSPKRGGGLDIVAKHRPNHQRSHTAKTLTGDQDGAGVLATAIVQYSLAS